MSKELYVASTPHETKVAVVEEDQLAEIYFERENEYTLAGSIYKGRVTRVLPGMQSAFVDVGLERDAFLYVTDFLEEQGEDDDVETSPLPQRQRQDARPPGPQPEIEGQTAGPIEAEEAVGEETEEITDAVGHEPLATGELTEAEAQGENAPDEPAGEQADAEGVRRWRGRRRRGGRRGGGREQSGEQFKVERPQRREDSSGYAPPPGYKAMILPGESIAKFSRSEQNTTQSGPEEPPAPQPQERTRERRESESRRPERGSFRREREPRRENWTAPPAGYQPIVLPGESIAKYRNAPPVSAQPTEEVGVEEQVDEHVSASDSSQRVEDRFQAEHSSAAAAPGYGEAHGIREQPTEEVSYPPLTEEIGYPPSPVAFEQTERASEPGPRIEEQHHIEAAAERQPQQPSRHEASRSSWFQRLFGRDEARDQQPNSGSRTEFEHAEYGAPGGEVIEPTSEQAEDRRTGHPSSAHSHFAPGEGHLEEEEIEEEETELAGLHEVGGEEDFVELEEHIIDRVADRAGEHATDYPISEIVDETAVEQSAEEGYEAGDESAEAAADEAHEEAEEAARAEVEGNGQAAVRGQTGTAGYQQRPQRPGFDRRRGGFRRGGRFVRHEGGRRREHSRPQPQIAELLKEGQEILVQIAKEPMGKKGARITSHIALPGRFLVYMPTVNHIGVSRKISSEEERQRLKRIVLSEREDGHGGFIVRTAADRADENELRADIRFLKNLWHEIRDRAEKSKPPALIYHDLNLVERILRDQVNQNFSSIWVDTESEYERMVRFVGRFQPSLSRRVKLYTKETPLFEQFGIQEEINKALKSKVWLKSGGYIVINQTEALVAIDVNTGKYVGKTARLEDTIVKTNVDAIKEIVRQIRLRDLGGIIVIDFIDMDERKNRHRVMQALEEALKADRAPSKVLQFNDFGLVAITRKRVKQSLERTLGAPCQYCTGTGLVKSVTTVCNEIWVEMRKMAKHFERQDIMLRVHPDVAKALKANNGRWIQEIEELTGRNLIVKSDPAIHQEQFDVT